MKMEFKDTLAPICIEEIKRFAQEHPDETFYGFALSCNVTYGIVLLAFNSIEALNRGSRMDDDFFPGHPADMAEELNKIRENLQSMGYAGDKPSDSNNAAQQQAEHYKWHIGNWTYLGTNGNDGHLLESLWEKKWSPIRREIETFFTDNSETMDWSQEDWYCERFLTEVFKALLEIEKSGVLDLLKKTGDFEVMVIDERQDENEAAEFTEKLRKEFASPAS